jgi:hypothetical protein
MTPPQAWKIKREIPHSISLSKDLKHIKCSLIATGANAGLESR